MSNRNHHVVYPLNHFTVLDIVGKDAAAIVHNVTTNEIKSLKAGESGNPGEGRETFITDVRGKTIGHGYVIRHDFGFRFLGAGDQAETLAAHLDKYTIREDAVPRAMTDSYQSLILPGGIDPKVVEGLVAGHSVVLYSTTILGPGTLWCLVPAEGYEKVCGWLAQKDIELADENHFHQARVAAAFPWYFVDLDEKNLPQELDRDDLAVSFTKGCYLGQETVARLDALGQVQRKLVRWMIADCVPPVGTTLDADGKTVGRLTSVAADGNGSIALGYARRTHFEPHSTAEGRDETSGRTFTATVT
ncbi:putative global regulator [Rubripirellula amarantea]|uniref:Putative global regulator n=1 Tax=Rubripirellula amarantea TaxID=2527999 RepID=A0A5C5WYP2_9BACT|nr:aminomethyltransferase [Rubripirellula amarantea]TWT55113.1 putative global regulator [Rubripirellula amarantea]